MEGDEDDRDGSRSTLRPGPYKHAHCTRTASLAIEWGWGRNINHPPRQYAYTTRVRYSKQQLRDTTSGRRTWYTGMY